MRSIVVDRDAWRSVVAWFLQLKNFVLPTNKVQDDHDYTLSLVEKDHHVTVDLLNEKKYFTQHINEDTLDKRKKEGVRYVSANTLLDMKLRAWGSRNKPLDAQDIKFLLQIIKKEELKLTNSSSKLLRKFEAKT